jgi:hypothetical protein
MAVVAYRPAPLRTNPAEAEAVPVAADNHLRSQAALGQKGP